MKYFFKPQNRIIESEELKRNYGSMGPIAALGMYELSVQPDYEPVSYEAKDDGTYYPVQCYEDKVAQARAALLAAGLTEEQADAALA